MSLYLCVINNSLKKFNLATDFSKNDPATWGENEHCCKIVNNLKS